jgi:hypothetical protein
MTSGKKGKEDKGLGSKRTRGRRSSKEAKLESTHGAWISRNQKRRTGKDGSSPSIVSQIPKDAISERPGKQQIVEKEE